MVKKIYIQNKIKLNETVTREAWLTASRALADQIRKNHGDQMIDVDKFLELDKQELADRIYNCLDE